jgi:hypothetical protein
MHATSGELSDSVNPFEVFVKIPHSKTVFTWGLNLRKPNGTQLKCQMYYYNSITKERKNSKVIPDDGIFLNHNNDSCYT